jgi:serine protease Do
VARAAADKRLAAGEVIVEVQYEAVVTTDDLQARLDKLRKDGKRTAILLVSTPEGDTRFVALSLE